MRGDGCESDSKDGGEEERKEGMMMYLIWVENIMVEHTVLEHMVLEHTMLELTALSQIAAHSQKLAKIP